MGPRFEAIGVPQMRELPPRRDQGVLQRVLGEIRVAQDPVSDRVEAIADLMHQDSERLPVAPPGPVDKISITVASRWCRASVARFTLL